jgi:hypothetical protein
MSTIMNLVKFNVGGQIFHTTKSTLLKCKGSFFEKLLSGLFEAAQDDQGNIFLDRSPDHFRTILEYLRNDILPDNPSESTLKEFQYYGIDLTISTDDDLCPYDYSNLKGIDFDDFYKDLPENFLENRDEDSNTEEVNQIINLFKIMEPNEKIIHLAHGGCDDEAYTGTIVITNYMKMLIITKHKFHDALSSYNEHFKNPVKVIGYCKKDCNVKNLKCSNSPCAFFYAGKTWVDPKAIKAVNFDYLNFGGIMNIFSAFE